MTIRMTRRRARSPKGPRAIGVVPRNHQRGTTLVAGLTTAGIGPARTLPGALDGAAWLVFVRDVLVPTLRPGQVVLLDNLNVHKQPEAHGLLEQAGCE